MDRLVCIHDEIYGQTSGRLRAGFGQGLGRRSGGFSARSYDVATGGISRDRYNSLSQALQMSRGSMACQAVNTGAIS